MWSVPHHDSIQDACVAQLSACLHLCLEPPKGVGDHSSHVVSCAPAPRQYSRYMCWFLCFYNSWNLSLFFSLYLPPSLHPTLHVSICISIFSSRSTRVCLVCGSLCLIVRKRERVHVCVCLSLSVSVSLSPFSLIVGGV